jgi:hypothetical protein
VNARDGQAPVPGSRGSAQMASVRTRVTLSTYMVHNVTFDGGDWAVKRVTRAARGSGAKQR